MSSTIDLLKSLGLYTEDVSLPEFTPKINVDSRELVFNINSEEPLSVEVKDAVKNYVKIRNAQEDLKTQLDKSTEVVTNLLSDNDIRRVGVLPDSVEIRLSTRDSMVVEDPNALKTYLTSLGISPEEIESPKLKKDISIQQLYDAMPKDLLERFFDTTLDLDKVCDTIITKLDSTSLTGVAPYIKSETKKILSKCQYKEPKPKKDGKVK